MNSLSKQKRVMRRRMRKPHELKLRRYSDCLIDLNNYFDVFHGSKLSEKIGMTELNEILLNSMTNSWSKQAYVQVFDCEYIIYKKKLPIFLNACKLQSLFTKVYYNLLIKKY